MIDKLSLPTDTQPVEAPIRQMANKLNEVVDTVNNLPNESAPSEPSEPTDFQLPGKVIDPNANLQEQFNEVGIYYIRDEINLTEYSITPLTIPSGSTLVFEGGRMRNGSLSADGVIISAPPVQIFGTITITGKLIATTPVAEWFGAKGNGDTASPTSDSTYINKTLSTFGRCYLLNKTYRIVAFTLPAKTLLIGQGIENTKLIFISTTRSTASLITANHGSQMRDLTIEVKTPMTGGVVNASALFAGTFLNICPESAALRDESHAKPRYLFQRLTIRFSDYPGSKANMFATGVRLADTNRRGIYHALIEDVDVEFCKVAFELYAANTSGTEGVSYVNTNRIDRCRSFDCATTLKMSSANSCEIRGNEIDITTQNLQEKDDTSPIYDIPTDFLCSNNNIKGYLWDIKTGKTDGPAGYGMYGGFVGNIGSNNAQHTNRIIYSNGSEYYIFAGVLHWGSDPNTQFARLRCSMINKAPVELHLIVDIDSKTGAQKPTIWQLVSIGTNWVASVHYVKHGNDYYIFLKGIPAGYLHVNILESLAYYPPAFVSNGTTLPTGDASGDFALGSVKQL